MGDACADYVGDFYDPTHQCPPFSGSEYCYGSDYLCNDTDYAYDCDFDNNRYSCAPGDLSGKFGTIPNGTSWFYKTNNVTDMYYNDLLPRTDDLIGKMFVIYCGNNTEGISYLTCAPLQEMDTVNTTTTTTTDSPSASPTPEPTREISGNTYEAVFSGSNDITGTVTVDNGYIIVDLDLSAEPALNGDYSECVSGGMKYHIHKYWYHDSDTDYANSTMCGSTYTGGHYDPWHGMF